jgi:tetratricopeptide (TPR) repeat protein
MNTTFTGRFARREALLMLATIVTLALSLILVPLAMLQDETWDCDANSDYMLQAESSISEGDYPAAAAAYECAIALDAENYPAYVWRGALTTSEGDYNQLGADLNYVMSHRTGNNDPITLAIAKTIPTWNSAISARSDDAIPYLLRGLAYVIVGIDASPDFGHVIELAPENAAGYLLLWLNSNPVAGADFTDENYVQGAELAGDSLLVDWVHAFAAIDMTEEIAEVNRAHYDEVVEGHPDHPFAFAARGMADIFLDDMATATNDYYQHIQNSQVEMADEAALTVGEEFTFQAATGTVYPLKFTAEAGQLLNVDATRSDGGVFFVFPVTQVVLNPAGEVMPAPYTVFVFMGGTRTPIEGLEITESGEYTLLVTPNYSGEVNIAVWEE